MIRLIVGMLLMLAGVVIGLYVGGWLMFIGGIVQVVTAAQMHPVPAMQIAIGVARVLGAGVTGTLCFFIFLVTGLGLVKAGLNS
jgi:hypothetical protein